MFLFILSNGKGVGVKIVPLIHWCSCHGSLKPEGHEAAWCICCKSKDEGIVCMFMVWDAVLKFGVL